METVNKEQKLSTTEKAGVSFNPLLCDVSSFIEFEKSCKKEIRGGIEMYDVKGHYKWLSLSELFKYWREQNIA